MDDHGISNIIVRTFDYELVYVIAGLLNCSTMEVESGLNNIFTKFELLIYPVLNAFALKAEYIEGLDRRDKFMGRQVVKSPLAIFLACLLARRQR